MDVDYLKIENCFECPFQEETILTFRHSTCNCSHPHNTTNIDISRYCKNNTPLIQGLPKDCPLTHKASIVIMSALQMQDIIIQKGRRQTDRRKIETRRRRVESVPFNNRTGDDRRKYERRVNKNDIVRLYKTD